MPQFNFSHNMTNKFTEENVDSPDCTPVLGEECVKAITRSGGISGASEGKCSGGVEKSWWSLPECADTLGSASRVDYGAMLWSAAIDSGANSTNGTGGDSEELKSGDGFLSITSAPFDNSDPGMTYVNASTRLHVIMLQAGFPLSTGAGNITKPSLLCTRVVANGLPNDSEEGGEGDGENAGFSAHASLVATFTAVFGVVVSLTWL